MSPLFFYLTCALGLVSVQAQSESAGSLLAVLRSNNLNAYADHLEFEAPDALAVFEQEADLTLFAPVSLELPSEFSGLQKRETVILDKRQGCKTEKSLQRPTMRLVRRQNQTDIPDSNYVLRETLLQDPSVANMGPGVPLSYVTNYDNVDEVGSAGTQLEVQTGFGVVVNTTVGPFKYNTGIIYGTDS